MRWDAEWFVHLFLPSSPYFREGFGMRVDVNTAKGKKKESGIGLLALIGALFVFGYLIASPSLTTHLPPSIERALTNYRNEIDKVADSAFTSVRDTLVVIGVL
jgi:hypothetical protein